MNTDGHGFSGNGLIKATDTINKNLLAKIKRKDAKNAEDRKENTASNCFLCETFRSLRLCVEKC
ncbi:MAG: hypothetical protein DRP64_14410 [Verrucomicrobia bacterium]|nr:MAG: hypothetical protein DRP64_14410 [Verrucomicrobiota bacterium]